MFCGSYKENDVQFLLKQIQVSSTSVQDKERNIQKNDVHYSEMITHEKAPSEKYMQIFYDALALNEEKFASHLLGLAHKLHLDYPKGEITLVSLARAGTPIGVLLKRILSQVFSRQVMHYTVSIIRDRGLDLNAMQYIINKHEDTSIAFIDGWTGKGIIGKELAQSVEQFNKEHDCSISSNLYVIADISGTAYWSATNEDYLIPSAVLNSTVSGLISRTILNTDYIGPQDFHGCLLYENLREKDISNWFIEHVLSIAIKLTKQNNELLHDIAHREINTSLLKTNSEKTVNQFLLENSLDNKNYIKPGVGESTRVLLRRVPKEIIIKDEKNANIQHILHLAKEKNILVRISSDLCYNCVAIIDIID